MEKGWGNQKEKMARKLIVISNEVFFVLVFGCGLCFVLQVNGDGEYGGVGLAGVMFKGGWLLVLF